MKLTVDFSFGVRKFKFGAVVHNWRSGGSVNEAQKRIIKLIDELKCSIFKAVDNLKQSLKEDLEERTKLVFRGTEFDGKSDDVLREFIVNKLREECLK